MKLDIKVKKSDTLYQLLEVISSRPLMYLRAASITLLQTYINGYMSGVSHTHGSLKKEEKDQKHFLPLPFDFFHDFVKNYYSEYESTPGWCNIILKNNNNDDEKSFEIFYKLIDIYKNLTVLNCQMAEISQDQNYYNISNEHTPKYSIGTNTKLYPVFPDTKKIFIYELSNDAGYICVVESEKEFQIINTIEKRKNKFIKCFNNLFGGKLKWGKIKFKNEIDKKYCFSIINLFGIMP